MPFGEVLLDGASDSGECDLEGCNRARDDNNPSDAETEDIMSGDENGQNARSHPAAAEEGDTTTATRAAAAAAQETDVCSVCQYRGRKLKHT